MKRSRKNAPFSLFAFQDIITGLCGIVILFVIVMIVDVVMKRDASRASRETLTVELEDKTEELRAEIASLKKELEQIKVSAKSVIVAAKDKAAPEIEAKLGKDFTQKEREVAALISQLNDLRTRYARAKEADAANKKRVYEMEETRRILEKRLTDLKSKKGVTLIPERGELKSPVYLVLGRGGVEVVRPIRKNVYRKGYFANDMETGLSDEFSKLDASAYTAILLVRPSGVNNMWSIVNFLKKLGFSYGRDPLEEDVEVDIGNANGGNL